MEDSLDVAHFSSESGPPIERDELGRAIFEEELKRVVSDLVEPSLKDLHHLIRRDFYPNLRLDQIIHRSAQFQIPQVVAIGSLWFGSQH